MSSYNKQTRESFPQELEYVISSTRIRLARNLDSYPFPAFLNERQTSEILTLLEHELMEINPAFKKYSLKNMSSEDASVLKEKHLISPALVKNGAKAAVFISPDEKFSVMVNEEDHLREQYISKDFEVFDAYEKISTIDECLSDALNFAYDKRLGYLTACPSNLGTGMRASLMMFLPALAKKNTLKSSFDVYRNQGLIIRGTFGEGSPSEGYTYQVSNERTLGVSEESILEQVYEAGLTLMSAELTAREELLKKDGLRLRDDCLRAYGTLTNCVLLSQEEMTELLTKIRMGIAFGFFRTMSIEAFDNFILEMQPKSFKKNNSPNSEEDGLRIRARLVANELEKNVIRLD